MTPWVAALVLAVVVAALAVWAVLSVRSATDRAARQITEGQAETMRWVSARLGELDRGLTRAQDSTGEALQRTLTERLQSMSVGLNAQVASSQQTLGDSLARATEVFGQLQGRLGEVSEMAARMEGLASEVAELGKVLTVPKLRGLMGEQTLEAMLRQVLPGRFWAAQHRFPDGRTVDAVVQLGDRLLPIDAKFPLEAFRRLLAADESAQSAARRDFARAVKGRIDEIAQRYLRPGEGTVDFALMFVPAEGVYAELVGTAGSGGDDLLAYGFQRRVLPVSPATLFAYISVIAAGLRGLEVEARANEVVRGLAATEQELTRFREEFTIVGKHLHNAAQRFTEAEQHLDRLDARLGSIAGPGE